MRRKNCRKSREFHTGFDKNYTPQTISCRGNICVRRTMAHSQAVFRHENELPSISNVICLDQLAAPDVKGIL
jgi:hypothetical protein